MKLIKSIKLMKLMKLRTRAYCFYFNGIYIKRPRTIICFLFNCIFTGELTSDLHLNLGVYQNCCLKNYVGD